MVNEGPVDPEFFRPILADLLDEASGSGVKAGDPQLRSILIELASRDEQLMAFVMQLNETERLQNDSFSSISSILGSHAQGLSVNDTKLGGLDLRVRGLSSLIGLGIITQVFTIVAVIYLLAR